MNSKRMILTPKDGIALAIIVAGASLALAQTAAVPPMLLTPDEMHWSAQGAVAASGMEQLNLIGDPAKNGPYTIRLKFPKGMKIAPHTHPDSREITVLSGVYATGYAEKADPAKLKVLPAGSFYTEPANIAHFIEIKEDVVLQVSGTGPSGRHFLEPAEARKAGPN
jgi:quercetin dioxygenase-like cupin family protein